MGIFVDLTGQMFGEWIVESRAENYRGNTVWLCRCSCGVEKEVAAMRLRDGTSKSCGHGRLTAGGLSHEYQSEYDTWRAMHVRCSDPSHPRYADYGGRGIRVCGRWDDFVAFLQDMGPRPYATAQIDRIDNEDGYFLENCEWVSPTENVHNSTRVRILEHDGIRLPVAEWARRLGMKPHVLYSRLHYGWSVERALTQPVRKPPPSNQAAPPIYARPRKRFLPSI